MLFHRFGFLGFVLFAILGCQPSGPKMVMVTGKITYDGQPVEGGEILFQPLEINTAPDAGPIVKGTFSVPAKLGTRKVEIRGTRSKGMTPMGPLMEQFLPAKYNSQSILTAEIREDGPREFTFDLKSR